MSGTFKMAKVDKIFKPCNLKKILDPPVQNFKRISIQPFIFNFDFKKLNILYFLLTLSHKLIYIC